MANLDTFINDNNTKQTALDETSAKNIAATTVLTRQSTSSWFKTDPDRTRLNTAVQVTENPDGTVTVKTAGGTNRPILKENLDDYQRIKANELTAYEQDRTEANAIRRWGTENQQIVKNSGVPLDADNATLLGSNLRSEFRSSPAAARFGYPPVTNVDGDFNRPSNEFDITDTARIQNLTRASRANDATVQGSGAASLSEKEQALLNENRRNAAFNQGARTNQGATTPPAATDPAPSYYETTQNDILSVLNERKFDGPPEDDAVELSRAYGSDSYVARAARGEIIEDEAAARRNTVSAVPIDNPLDEFDSYTYGIALHILTKDQYNTMVQSSGKTLNITHTLIASAGRAGAESGFKRAPGWEDNFFFDKLTFSSVVGLNKDSRGTNVLALDFTIIEPMGLSLIDRLIRTTQNLYAAGRAGTDTSEISYFHNCYLLQIDFFDSQKGVIQRLRKHIPIKFTDLRIKVTSRGSEYMISAVPFNHQALFQSFASTPANFECIAGTLKDFFQSDDPATAARATAESQRENNPNSIGNINNNVTQQLAGVRSTDKPVSVVKDVKSYVAAYNAWYQELKKYNVTDKTKSSTTIAVVFDDEFFKEGADKLYREGIGQAVGDTPMVDNKTEQPANNGNIPANRTKDRFMIGAGTQVTEVINMAMQNTDYIRKQIIIPEKTPSSASSNDQPAKNVKLKWWKIVPAIKLKDFDSRSNHWSFDITYYVVPFEIFNTVHPHAPKAKPTKEICVREYEYLYTGKNVSVIDFQVDFDYMYFVNVLAWRDKGTDSPIKAETSKVEERAGTDTNDNSTNSSVASPVLKPVTDETTATGQRTRNDEIGMAVSNVAKSIYSSARGEMLNVTMKIIGDPMFIKQDDLFTGLGRALDNAARTNSSDGVPSQSNFTGSVLEDNNYSLRMDNGDLCVWVNLRLPVDYDDKTGGVRNGQGDISSFTGVYKILSIDNEFVKGQFTQTLQMIRYLDQPADETYRAYNSERLGRSQSIGRGNDSTDNLTAPANGNDSSNVIIGSPVFPAGDEGKRLAIERGTAFNNLVNELERPRPNSSNGVFSNPTGANPNPGNFNIENLDDTNTINPNQRILIDTFRTA